jgi:hypothetical protein
MVSSPRPVGPNTRAVRTVVAMIAIAARTFASKTPEELRASFLCAPAALFADPFLNVRSGVNLFVTFAVAAAAAE